MEGSPEVSIDEEGILRVSCARVERRILPPPNNPLLPMNCYDEDQSGADDEQSFVMRVPEMEIRPASIVSVRGMGKTTLFRAISNGIPPEDAAFMFQAQAFLVNTTVRDMLRNNGNMDRIEDPDFVQDVLDVLGLVDQMDARAGDLGARGLTLVSLAAILSKPARVFFIDAPIWGGPDPFHEACSAAIRSVTDATGAIAFVDEVYARDERIPPDEDYQIHLSGEAHVECAVTLIDLDAP